MDSSKTNTYTYRVLPQDLDGKRHFRAVAMERVLMNTAGRAANDRNFGTFKLMDTGGVSWILLKMAFEISQMPQEDDLITIETWVEKVNSLITSRNFAIRNEAGQPVGHATSEWAILNLETRHPVSITSDTTISDCATGISVPVAMPGRLKHLTTAEATSRHSIKVSYSDIDYNGHTNSVQYLQWMLDSYPIEKVYGRQIARLEIIYAQEVRYGETVDILYRDMDDGSTLFAVQAADGSDCARAKIIWKQ